MTPVRARGLLVVRAELAFQREVDALGLLLLAQLQTVADDFFTLRSWPCWPGGKLRFSTGHLSVKHLAPFRKSFMPSRRQRRQTAPV